MMPEAECKVIGKKPPARLPHGERNLEDEAAEEWIRSATWEKVLRRMVGMERRIAALEGRKAATKSHRQSRMEPGG